MATETAMSTPQRVEVTRRESTRGDRWYRPNVDILETAEELRLYVDVPGTRPDAIDVRFENGTLEVRAKAAPRQPEDTRYLRREYGVGDFYRAFEISERIDAARIEAEYRDGVLTLHLPKVEAARPRKISVKAS